MSSELASHTHTHSRRQTAVKYKQAQRAGMQSTMPKRLDTLTVLSCLESD